MASKGHKGKGKGKGTHRNALSLDSSFGNLALTPTTEISQSSKASKDEDEVDIIGYERVALKPEADVRVAAQNIFATAAESGTYSQPGDILAFGNSSGHRLLEEREENRSQWATQKLINAHQDQKIAGLEQRVADLNAQVKVLKDTSEGYLLIRNRFLDAYRRDILKEAEAQGTQAIKDGNRAAHHGDAVTDASLYESNLREDEFLLFEIYGFSAREILSLSRAGDYDSIWILNARATLKAKEGRIVPPDIEKAWEIYVSELRRNWRKSPKEDHLSPLGRAYNGFLDVYKKH